MVTRMKFGQQARATMEKQTNTRLTEHQISNNDLAPPRVRFIRRLGVRSEFRSKKSSHRGYVTYINSLDPGSCR